MSIKKIMHKDRHGAQVSIEFGEGGAASQLVEQFLGGMGVPAMQDIPQQHPGGPKGTDTVPAWLTPGEFVMNAEATRMFEPQIEEMNNAGRAVQRQQGGSIPEYKAEGGYAEPEYLYGGSAVAAPGEGEYFDTTGMGDKLLSMGKAGIDYAIENPLEVASYGLMLVPAASGGMALIRGIGAANKALGVSSKLSNLARGTSRAMGKGYDKALKKPITKEKPMASRWRNGVRGPATTMTVPAGLGYSIPKVATAGALGLQGANMLFGDDGVPSDSNGIPEVPSNVTDGTAPLSPSQAAAGMVAPVRDLSMTTEQIDKNVADRKAAALKEIETTITTGGYTEDSVKKYRESGNPEDLVDLEDESMFSKAKNFFKKGFDTVIDKGALGEAATLYLGSRALGYDHEGSLDFVTQRYSKGIEDKLANANKAIGSYTPKSIEAYRLSGDMNDLVEITTTKNLNERVGWVDRMSGDVKRLNKYEDGKGNVFYVDSEGKVVDTSGMTMKKHYDEDRNTYEKQLRPVVKGFINKYVSDLDDDDRENAADKFNQEGIVATLADYATQNGYETAEITKQVPNLMAGIVEYYSAGAAKQRKKRGEGEMGVQDLVELIITNSVNKPLADDRAMNLTESGDPVDLNVASEQVSVGVKGIEDFGDKEERAQMLQSIYEIAWKPLSLNEKQKYEDRARKGSNGFYTFIQMQGHMPTKQQWLNHMLQKYESNS